MEELNKTQFVYKREIPKVPAQPKTDTSDAIEMIPAKTVYDSFNINCVIRSLTMDDGGMLVLLDDLHERVETKPVPSRNGKVSMKEVKNTFQSEIFLTAEEGEQFLKVTSINNYE